MNAIIGRPAWDECAPFFEPDGALRDIYIAEVGQDGWSHWLDSIAASGLRFEGAVDQGTAMHLWLASGVHLWTSFYDPDEIEVSLDPVEVGDPQAFEDLLGLIELSARAAGRAASLTDENRPEHPFLTYTPDEGVWRRWRSPGAMNLNHI